MGTRPSKRGKTKWYLGTVNPKKNIVWTRSMRKEVYTLRKDLPAKEVARKMELTVIQIYNATRMFKKGLLGECFSCGHKLTKKEKLASEKEIKTCFKCKNKASVYKKVLREEAKKKGLCIYCTKRKAQEGTVSCKKCVSATHRRRYCLNLCGQCGENNINYPEESLCSECSKKNKIRAADMRAMKKDIIAADKRVKKG